MSKEKRGWKQICWHVYLNNRWINSVFFNTDCDSEYVKDSLVNHDGYNANIVVLPQA